MEIIYEITILDEPKFDAYKRLMDYAMAKSDAFMLIARYDFAVIQEFQPAKKEIFDNKKQYLAYLNTLKRMEKEAITNVGIFKEQTEPFLKNLQPFLIKQRHKPTEWPSTKVLESDSKTKIDINVYKVCEQIEGFIYEPNGLYRWIYPYFPEDLCFFKDGYCWFSTCAHEKFAFIYSSDINDINELKGIGLNFSAKEHRIREYNLFYEQY